MVEPVQTRSISSNAPVQPDIQQQSAKEVIKRVLHILLMDNGHAAQIGHITVPCITHVDQDLAEIYSLMFLTSA